jgi:hypothetical protein
MGPFVVKATHILIQVRLQGLQVAVDLLPERHPIKLVEDRLLGPLADPIGLGALHLGLRVIDLVELQEQLIGCLSGNPQYSVPRSVSTLRTGTS